MTASMGTLLRPLAQRLHDGHMHHLGIANTMRLAHAFNRLKYRRQENWRRALYRAHFSDLLRENGPFRRRPLEMRDGWAMDTTLSLPHLDRVLEEGERILVERGGAPMKTPGTYRSFFQDVWVPEDAERYPAFLDFATSTDLLATVSHYLKCIPALSTTMPSGVRLVESNAAFDPQPDVPKDSQLYHIDYYSRPNVYVLVLLRDTTFEHGPWTFLPRSASRKVKKALGYWKWGKPYRVSDEDVYSVVDRSEAVEFAYPRGTVLFIESSGCFHFGSRNSVLPRHQLMLGYTGACRTDFTEAFMTPKVYPVRESDSLLRRMVLTKNLLPSDLAAPSIRREAA